MVYVHAVTIRPTQRPAIAGLAIALPLAALALYGLASTPGLVIHWGASLAGIALLLAWLGACLFAIPLIRRVPGPVTLVALVVVAVALRLIVAACFAHREAVGDALSYLDLAATLTAGKGLHIYEPYIGLTLQAFYPPVYPLLLAGWHAIAGTSTISLVLLNALIDGTAAALLARLGTMTGRRGAGRGAAWLYLIWPSVLLSTPLAQKEGLCIVLVLGLAIAWLRAIATPGSVWARAGLVGALAALLALTQPGLAPLGLVVGLVFVPLTSWRRIIAIGLRALPFAILAMLPWWVRNWSLLHAFVPLTSAGAVSLWIGNNPGATGNWMPEPAALKGVPELGYARTMAGLAETWIRENPAAFVRLTVTKLVRACGIAQFGIVRLAAMTPQPMAAITALLFPLSQAAHLLLLGGSATAALARIRRVPLPLLLLLAACALQIMLFGVWFEFGERHRDVATPLLLLLLTCALSPATDQGTTVTNR